MSREMKDSEISWIGNIPSDWKMLRVKNLFSTHKEIVGAQVDNFERLALTLGGVIKRSKTDSDGLQPEGFNNYQILRKGELVFKLIDLENVSTSRVGLSPYTGIVSPAYIVAMPNHNVNVRYADHYFRSMWKREIFNHLGDDGVRSSLNSRDLLNIPFCTPSLCEQKRIANFLDNQCSEIDSVLARTRASIEEYKKMKRAVVTQAVTKGIRKNRKMKACCNGWVMELPDDWTEIPSKFLFRNSDTRRLGSDEQLTASQKYGIISQHEYMSRENSRIVLADKGLENWKHVEPYDFIISLRSFQGGLEMSEVTGCITWHYIVLKPCKTIYSKYFKWLFKSELYIKALQRTCNFIRDGQDLRYSNFVQVPLFEPPIEEQKEIAYYLDRTCSEIDTLIVKKEQYLVELENYKKTLIYEYVTGKKEVS